MTKSAHTALREHLERNAAGAAEKVAEGKIQSAFEEFYVGMLTARMAMNMRHSDLTAQHVELASRLAWAQAELERGSSARLPDDLEAVEELADEVSHD